jgi:hypothetical protein
MVPANTRLITPALETVPAAAVIEERDKFIE